MPLYEYQCDRDGRFEVIRKFSDPPLKKCPTCGGPVQRLPSAPAIQFKGTGWYVTDYAKKSGGDGAKGKEGDKGGSEATASSAAAGDASSSKTDSSKSEKPAKTSGSAPKKKG